MFDSNLLIEKNCNWTFSLSATIDVKKTIFDLCTDVTDSFVAVIEVIFSRSIQQYLNYWIYDLNYSCTAYLKYLKVFKNAIMYIFHFIFFLILTLSIAIFELLLPFGIYLILSSVTNKFFQCQNIWHVSKVIPLYNFHCVTRCSERIFPVTYFFLYIYIYFLHRIENRKNYFQYDVSRST